MDRYHFSIPSDFRSRPEFRHLAALASDPLRAAGMVMVLFGDLAYAAERDPVGFLSEANARIFSQSLDKCMAGDPVELLSRPPGFLAPVEGGWFCQAFAERNRHCNPLALSIQEMAGQAVGLRKQLKAQARLGFGQQILSLDPVLFIRPDGAPMEPAEAHRAENLIRSADACFTPGVLRKKEDFLATLIQNAWRVCREFEEEEINRVLCMIRKHVGTGHPALPKNTLDLLENFKRYTQ